MEILLYSGGLDSLIAWEYLHRRPIRIFLDAGHRYAAEEESRLPADIFIDRTTDLSKFEPANGIIPGRNMAFALAAARHLPKEGGTIWFSVQKYEQSTVDKRPAAFQTISRALSANFGARIRVRSPFWAMTKTEMVRWYLDHAGENAAEDLRAAWSCYAPTNNEHCGNCGACIRKYIALSVAGIDTSGIFAMNPPESPTAAEYIARAESGYYPEERALDMLAHLR